MRCLSPPLASVPEGEWLCPGCTKDVARAVEKIDQNKKNVIKKRATSTPMKMRRTLPRKVREPPVPPGHFGPVPGVEVGMSWKHRYQLCEAGVHMLPLMPIAGRARDRGAQSVVLCGAHAEDHDDGEEFVLTGVRAKEKMLYWPNKGLALNYAAAAGTGGNPEEESWRKGKPVRVVRGFKLAQYSPFAPGEGFRYDGIYKVVSYWPEERGAAGWVWRFHLKRDDPAPAPWTKEGRAKISGKGYPQEEEVEDERPAAKKTLFGINMETVKKNDTLAIGNTVIPKPVDKAAATPMERKKVKEDGNAANEVLPSSLVEVVLKESRSASEEPRALIRDPGDTRKQRRRKNAVAETKRCQHQFQPCPELQALIAGDHLNARVWKALLQMPLRDGDAFVRAVAKVFRCPVCRCIPREPTRLFACGHTLCKKCLRGLLAKEATGGYSSPACPECGRSIQGGDGPAGEGCGGDVGKVGARNWPLRLVLKVIFGSDD